MYISVVCLRQLRRVTITAASTAVISRSRPDFFAVAAPYMLIAMSYIPTTYQVAAAQ